jgi:hypothetical protein
MLDVDVAASLLELLKAHNVDLEAQNEVDTSKSSVLTALSNEEYGVAPFDLDDRPITKFDRATDPEVKLQEGFPSPGHLDGRPHVKDPPLVITMLTAGIDLSKYMLL